MRKTIILLLIISTFVFGQGVNGRRLNKRNKFKETYLIDQGFEYRSELEEWRYLRCRLDETGQYICLERIGDTVSTEEVSEISLRLPVAAINVLDSSDIKRFIAGKSNTRDAINLGDINWSTRIFTDNKLEKYKQFQRFDKLVIQSTKSAIEITDTLILEVNIPGIPGFAADGAINDAFWLDTVEGSSNVRITARLNDANGPLIYENVSQLAFENGAGATLLPGESSFDLIPGFDSEYPLIEYVVFQFAEPIQIRGWDNGGTFVPWQAADGYFYQSEEILSLLNWRDDVNYAIDDYITENGVIYQAMEAGYQTGDFASNRSKWCAVRGYFRLGEMYFNENTTATAISLSDTWYEIDTTTGGTLKGFTFSGGDLIADTGTIGTYEISYALSAEGATAGNIYDFAVSKNDVIINKSISETKFISQDIESVPGQAVLAVVEEGDVFKMEVRNLTAGNDITVKYGNFMIEQVCD